jgi:flagellar protein FlgJ
MLNADFKLGAGGFPSLPSAPASQGGGFSGLYRELHQEVSRFIENGSGTSSAATPTRAPASAATLSPEGLWSQLQTGTGAPPSEAQQAFLREIAPMAEAAAQRLGVAPEVLAAHAALESGWGSKPIRREDGSDSHNLFALKAGASWRGEVAEVTTTEYEQGQPEKRREGFRAYASPAQAFQDFAQLLLGNPRYQGALQTGADAQAYGNALQKGGYATDPAYADKLASVAARIKGAR